MPHYLSDNQKIKEYSIEFGELLNYIINPGNNAILKFLEDGLFHVLTAYTLELFNLLNSRIVEQIHFDQYEPRHELLAEINNMVKTIMSINDIEKINEVNNSLMSVYITDYQELIPICEDEPEEVQYA
jgi:hypothetical protein